MGGKHYSTPPSSRAAWTSRPGGCARCQPASVYRTTGSSSIGDAGVMIRRSLAHHPGEYFRQRQVELERERLPACATPPAITIDGQKIRWANIEQPDDAAAAVRAKPVGVGLFRSEFLFMGKSSNLPGGRAVPRLHCEGH